MDTNCSFVVAGNFLNCLRGRTSIGFGSANLVKTFPQATSARDPSQEAWPQGVVLAFSKLVSAQPGAAGQPASVIESGVKSRTAQPLHLTKSGTPKRQWSELCRGGEDEGGEQVGRDWWQATLGGAGAPVCTESPSVEPPSECHLPTTVFLQLNG